MGGLSWWHWLVIAAVFILLFGAEKLPDAARTGNARARTVSESARAGAAAGLLRKGGAADQSIHRGPHVAVGGTVWPA